MLYRVITGSPLRAAFEAWYFRTHTGADLRRRKKGYVSEVARVAWRAWQAAHAEATTTTTTTAEG
jgi:hypothetical protein